VPDNKRERFRFRLRLGSLLPDVERAPRRRRTIALGEKVKFRFSLGEREGRSAARRPRRAMLSWSRMPATRRRRRYPPEECVSPGYLLNSESA
jgi:hypothetical protein